MNIEKAEEIETKMKELMKLCQKEGILGKHMIAHGKYYISFRIEILKEDLKMKNKKPKVVCLFNKGKICNSDYARGLDCDGIKPPKKCSYNYNLKELKGYMKLKLR